MLASLAAAVCLGISIFTFKEYLTTDSRWAGLLTAIFVNMTISFYMYGS